MEQHFIVPSPEPCRYMYVLKQHYTPDETLKKPTLAFLRQFINNKEDNIAKSLSIVEHQFTDSNQACVKFTVFIEQAAQEKKPKTRRNIQVC